MSVGMSQHAGVCRQLSSSWKRWGAVTGGSGAVLSPEKGVTRGKAETLGAAHRV